MDFSGGEGKEGEGRSGNFLERHLKMICTDFHHDINVKLIHSLNPCLMQVSASSESHRFP